MRDNAQESSRTAHQLSVAVDRAITAAVPGLIDLQVAATAEGVVIVSACVSTTQEQQRIEEVARSVPGVRQLTGSFVLA